MCGHLLKERSQDIHCGQQLPLNKDANFFVCLSVTFCGQKILKSIKIFNVPFFTIWLCFESTSKEPSLNSIPVAKLMMKITLELILP